MPINDWWVDDPAQKYWMEITDRKDLGDDLRAPQAADDGQNYAPQLAGVKHST
jgi:hypothetical protein